MKVTTTREQRERAQAVLAQPGKKVGQTQRMAQSRYRKKVAVTLPRLSFLAGDEA